MHLSPLLKNHMTTSTTNHVAAHALEVLLIVQACGSTAEAAHAGAARTGVHQSWKTTDTHESVTQSVPPGLAMIAGGGMKMTASTHAATTETLGESPSPVAASLATNPGAHLPTTAAKTATGLVLGRVGGIVLATDQTQIAAETAVGREALIEWAIATYQALVASASVSEVAIGMTAPTETRGPRGMTAAIATTAMIVTGITVVITTVMMAVGIVIGIGIMVLEAESKKRTVTCPVVKPPGKIVVKSATAVGIATGGETIAAAQGVALATRAGADLEAALVAVSIGGSRFRSRFGTISMPRRPFK